VERSSAIRSTSMETRDLARHAGSLSRLGCFGWLHARCRNAGARRLGARPLRGKVAVVTGAARGIGRAAAVALARERRRHRRHRYLRRRRPAFRGYASDSGGPGGNRATNFRRRASLARPKGRSVGPAGAAGGRRESRTGIRRRRYPVRQCGHPELSSAARNGGRGLEHNDRHQSDRLGQRRAGLRASHCEARWRRRLRRLSCASFKRAGSVAPSAGM